MFFHYSLHKVYKYDRQQTPALDNGIGLISDLASTSVICCEIQWRI